MRGAEVELIGSFETAETKFLEASFDHCRIELLARSQFDSSMALLRWTPAHAGDASAVTDRRRVPLAAYYLLTNEREFKLTPVASGSDLRQKFPDHFAPDVLPEPPVRRGCLPGLFGMALRLFG